MPSALRKDNIITKEKIREDWFKAYLRKVLKSEGQKYKITDENLIFVLEDIKKRKGSSKITFNDFFNGVFSMNLCQKCGGYVLKDSHSCVKCGHVLKQKNKGIELMMPLSFLLLGLFVLILNKGFFPSIIGIIFIIAGFFFTKAFLSGEVVTEPQVWWTHGARKSEVKTKVDEKIYYKDKVVLVSASNFIAYSTSYSISDIKSVKIAKNPFTSVINLILSLIFILIGLFIFLLSALTKSYLGLLIGIIIIAVGISLRNKKNIHYLEIKTSSGVERALSDEGVTDRLLNVEEALNKAINERY
jgi:uncharacterized membrane protein HdeD (DUF308 family)